MADADVDDIRRVLAVCFRSGQSLSDLDIERILSFDMGWLSPEEAGEAVKALIDSGWLTGDLDALSSVLTSNPVTTPLGWFPRPSRLMNPIKYDSVKFQDASSDVERVVVNQSNNTTSDIIERGIPRFGALLSGYSIFTVRQTSTKVRLL